MLALVGCFARHISESISQVKPLSDTTDRGFQLVEEPRLELLRYGLRSAAPVDKSI